MTNQQFKNISRIGRCTLGAAAFAVSGTLVTAEELKRDIRNDTVLESFLMTANVVTKLVVECPSIEARPKRVAELVEAVQKAIDAGGYSPEEQAVLNSPEYVDFINTTMATHMAERGVIEDDNESLCAFGKNEISARTAIGKNLRKN